MKKMRIIINITKRLVENHPDLAGGELALAICIAVIIGLAFTFAGLCICGLILWGLWSWIAVGVFGLPTFGFWAWFLVALALSVIKNMFGGE